MTNRIAATLFVLVLLLIAVDVLLYGTDHLLFIAKKLLALIDWLAFWR